MVYYEKRKTNGKILNYLVFNERVGSKWIKKSKFIGFGKISKKRILQMKKDFEKQLIIDKHYEFLAKNQVQEIETFREIYNAKIKSFAKEDFSQFKKSFFTELTYNSNAIEGNSLSLQETSLVINDNLAPEGKSLREIYEAKNHALALQFLEDYKGSLTEDLILKLHSMILKNISNRFGGIYRKTSVRVAGSDFKFPTPEKVPQLVKNLIYWYNKNKKKYHPFELAILISMKFVSIHPFVDGNGRVSRLIMNFLLNKNSYPWLNIYDKQREKYLKAVRKANDEHYSFIFPFSINTLKQNLKEFGFLD